MRALPAVRELETQLNAAAIDTLLINIHDEVGSRVLDRFDFALTPTFIVYDAGGGEVWRGNDAPSLADVRAALSPTDTR